MHDKKEAESSLHATMGLDATDSNCTSELENEVAPQVKVPPEVPPEEPEQYRKSLRTSQGSKSATSMLNKVLVGTAVLSATLITCSFGDMNALTTALQSVDTNSMLANADNGTHCSAYLKDAEAVASTSLLASANTYSSPSRAVRLGGCT